MLQPHVAWALHERGAYARRAGQALRHAELVRGGRADRLLGRQGVLGLLASDHGNPARRQRRRRKTVGDPWTSLPARRPTRIIRPASTAPAAAFMHAATAFFGKKKMEFGLTATFVSGVASGNASGDGDASLRAFHRRDRRHDRRTRVAGDPLPIRGRRGRPDRRERRPLGRQARAAISQVTRYRQKTVECGGDPRERVSSRCGHRARRHRKRESSRLTAGLTR